MGLFGFFDKSVNNEDEVYDEDETDELLADSALYIEAPLLRSTCISITPKDIYSLDTNGWLEFLQELPYDFRCYFDTRRAFSNALRSCREDIADFESYEGGRRAEYSESYDYDDHSVVIDFTLSRDGDRAPYVFTADIKIDE